MNDNKRKLLGERLAENYASYLSRLDTMSAHERRNETSPAAMNQLCRNLTVGMALSEEDVNCLLRYRDPLMAVADVWRAYDYAPDDLEFAIMDVRDIDQFPHDYPLVGRKPCRKYADVDITAVMESMYSNRAYFAQEIEAIKRAAEKAEVEDRWFLLRAGKLGPVFLPEREVFLRNSHAYASWLLPEPDSVAYAVKITGHWDGKIVGNLYELDHAQHREYVRFYALPIERVHVHFISGNTHQLDEREYIDRRLELYLRNDISHIEFIPCDESDLRGLLAGQRQRRARYEQGDLREHLDGLAMGRLEREAKRVTAALMNPENQSDDGDFSVAPISQSFLETAADGDAEKLLDRLPFEDKYLMFHQKLAQYILVGKQELETR